VNPGGRHRLTTDWANRAYVVYVNYDGSITRVSPEGRFTLVLGDIGDDYSPVEVGDTFPAGA
jgi:hypothetical protein